MIPSQYVRKFFKADKSQLDQQLIYIEQEAKVLIDYCWEDLYTNNRRRPHSEQSFVGPLCRRRDMTLALYWGKRHPSSRRGQPKFTTIKHERLTDLYKNAPRWQHALIKEAEAELAILRRQIKTIGKISLYLTQLEAHVRRNHRRLEDKFNQDIDNAFNARENYYPGA
jgi:hypothetical protein